MGTLLWALRSRESFALLDASPLYDLVRDHFPRAQVRKAIDSGACHAFYISATDLQTGFNTIFTDTADPNLQILPGPNMRVERVQVRPEHLLASAALPLLFEPVSVDGRFYVDGGLRQNTPLRPVIKAGADRVLVVSVRRVRASAPEVTDGSTIPNLMYLAGKSLNSLLLDPVERDLGSVENINEFIEWGAAQYGPDFVTSASKHLGMRHVHTMFLRPEEDLGALAREMFQANPPKVSAMLRRLLSMASNPGDSAEADLLSYLYFDQTYTAELEALGFRDAARQEERLAAFFGEPPE